QVGSPRWPNQTRSLSRAPSSTSPQDPACSSGHAASTSSEVYPEPGPPSPPNQPVDRRPLHTCRSVPRTSEGEPRTHDRRTEARSDSGPGAGVRGRPSATLTGTDTTPPADSDTGSLGSVTYGAWAVS